MTRIHGLPADEAEDLLTHTARGIPEEHLVLPGRDFVDRIVAGTDRSPQVLRDLQSLFDHGRPAGTGYVSILPVGQGIEHSAASAFEANPRYLDDAVTIA
ncbi:hypothetical protein AB0P17_37040 [Streptomyces sp. NPDC088124]|uniref:hypothetical protein n=1 Tax=Streptomyces sp. NPDC088124 TaxID=3154654 RepID=UPI00342E51D9